jgi:hypothetical protein
MDNHDLDEDWASSFREFALQFVDVLRGRSDELLWNGGKRVRRARLLARRDRVVRDSPRHVMIDG